MDNYANIVKNIIDEIEEKENDNIKKAAKILFSTMKNGGILHVFATGHSHMVAEELFYRSGGLIQVNPILEPFLMQHEGAIRSTQFERLSGIAEIIFKSLDLKEEEPFLIVSNSGINAVPVEMAEIAKNNGHKVIVITSKEASSISKPRTKNNKKLMDVADIIIDNHTPLGDAVIKKDFGSVGAVSTICCSFIAQKLVLEVINYYEKEKITPAVYKSANTPGGDEHNKLLINEYKKRIKSLY